MAVSIDDLAAIAKAAKDLVLFIECSGKSAADWTLDEHRADAALRFLPDGEAHTVLRQKLKDAGLLSTTRGAINA